MKSTILTIMFVLAAITGQAQNTVNNFKIDVKVTQGIEDSGYLVHLFNSNQSERNQIGRITVQDKRTSFETHIDEPLVGDLTAIFPDGSICSACVRFPFVPGEYAEVKVKNGTFELSGTTFYKQWADADELEENAHKYYKQWETDSIILNYFKKHADEEGCVMRYWQYSILPRPTILSMIPESVKNGRFKHFFDGYQPATAEYVPAKKVSAPCEKCEAPDFTPTPMQRMQIEQKGRAIEFDMDMIKHSFESIAEELDDMKYQFKMDMDFDQITMRNKDLDKHYQELLKTLKSFKIPSNEATKLYENIYSEILKFYSEQNKNISDFYKEYGSYTKQAQKAQKSVNKLTEKYIKEMRKTLAKIK